LTNEVIPDPVAGLTKAIRNKAGTGYLAVIKGMKALSAAKDAMTTVASTALTWTPSAKEADTTLIMIDVYAPKPLVRGAVAPLVATITFNAMTGNIIRRAGADITITPIDNGGYKIVIAGLKPGTKYTLEMQAQNSTGDLSKVTKFAASTVKYAAVKTLKATAGLESVKLTWDASKLPASAETDGFRIEVYHYTLYKKLTDPIISLYQFGTDPTAMIEGLESAKRYAFKVYAVSSSLDVESLAARVNVLTVNPATYPSVLYFNATVNRTTNAVTLSWKESKVLDTIGYEVVVCDVNGEERIISVVPGEDDVTVSDKGYVKLAIMDLAAGKYTLSVRAVTANDVKSKTAVKKLVALKELG
jgi:hypothetical protein